MGNEVSKSSEHKEEIHIRQMDEPTTHIFQTDNYSYNGMKSDLNSTYKSGSNISLQTADKTNDDDRVLTKFEWREGASMVYVTGSFVNWTQWFIMQKIEDNYFELTLELTRGTHQFKFIVDSVWKYSHHIPVQKDSRGNINNYVDNTTFKKAETRVKERKPKDKEKDEGLSLTKGSGGVLSEEFGDVIPKRSDMNTESPSVPVHYQDLYCKYRNTRQHKLCNPEFLSPIDHYYSSENSSFKCVNSVPHVSL